MLFQVEHIADGRSRPQLHAHHLLRISLIGAVGQQQVAGNIKGRHEVGILDVLLTAAHDVSLDVDVRESTGLQKLCNSDGVAARIEVFALVAIADVGLVVGRRAVVHRGVFGHVFLVV